jgi:hypothetical protein
MYSAELHDLELMLDYHVEIWKQSATEEAEHKEKTMTGGEVASVCLRTLTVMSSGQQSAARTRTKTGTRN